MADAYTDLGKTIEEYVNEAGKEIITVRQAYERAKKAYDAVERSEALGSEMRVKNEDMYLVGKNAMGEEKLDLVGHIACYDKIGALLKIPVPYLVRLGPDMRADNINYWLKKEGDRKFALGTRRSGDETTPNLVEFGEAKRQNIDFVDCLKALYEKVGGSAQIIRTDSSLGHIQIDILIPDKRYDVGETYMAGIRFVHKRKFQAPEVSPIFLNEASCGIIECDDYLDPINIRDLSYDDILRVIGEKVENAVDSLEGLAYTMREVYGEEIPRMRKRIMHMYSEHGLPARVRATSLTCFDEYRLGTSAGEHGTTGELIDLITSSCFIAEIKPNSVRKLQRLAGYVVVRSHKEHRCNNCDAILIDEV